MGSEDSLVDMMSITFVAYCLCQYLPVCTCTRLDTINDGAPLWVQNLNVKFARRPFCRHGSQLLGRET